MFSGRLKEIGADKGSLVAVFQIKIKIAAQNTDFMAETGFLIDGVFLHHFFHAGELIMEITEITVAERTVQIRKACQCRKSFCIMFIGVERSFLTRRKIIFHAADGFLRIEEHSRCHFMEDRSHGTQAFDPFFANTFFIAFAKDHCTGVLADLADDGSGFFEGIDGGKFGLDKKPQFIARIIKGFRRTPCMTADKVESGIFQDLQIMQILLFIKMRVACFREITMLCYAPEIGGIAIDQNRGAPAHDSAGGPLPDNGIHRFGIQQEREPDIIEFRRSVAPPV